jgi:hypothetical protein
MKKVQYAIAVHAPASKVFTTMLGIGNKSNYEQWTALFNPTSTYEGTWEKGSKMFFCGVDENGNKGGLVSEIVEHIPNEFISIHHYGLLQGDNEITSGAEVEKWAGGQENYTFKESQGITTITVDLDTPEDFVDYMNESYPKALDKLKELCEV